MVASINWYLKPIMIYSTTDYNQEPGLDEIPSIVFVSMGGI
jgi:hypothetical protein